MQTPGRAETQKESSKLLKVAEESSSSYQAESHGTPDSCGYHVLGPTDQKVSNTSDPLDDREKAANFRTIGPP